MNYREVILEDDKTLADSGTETFDINILDPITEILLKYKVKNSTATAADVPPEKTITKIELVDGGQTYLSMTGYEAVAAAAYDKGRWPPHSYSEVLSSNQRITIPLLFGRYVGDPEYAFDPTRLRNPQLKFTWAKDTLHLTAMCTLGISAKVMEGVVAPSKALLWKGVESWTGGTSGVKVVDLFNDYPYRRVMIRSFEADTTIESCITHFKLTCDADKLIVFDCDAAEFQDINIASFGPFQLQKMDEYAATGIIYRQCHIAGRTIVVGSPGTQYMMGLFWASGASRYALRVVDHSGAEPTTCHVQVLITGHYPHSTYCYQFGLPNEPATWFNAPGFKDIDLKLTEGAAAANSVLVQQPRSLP